MKKIYKYIKMIRAKDILGIFKFIIAIIPSLILFPILKRKKIWLVMETVNEAGDNGYHFYNYVVKNHKDINIYYAINKNSNDYKKLLNKSNVIQVGSIKHFIYYNLAEFNIFTHKNSNPCNIVYFILNRLGFKKNKRIFLQHGIILNDTDYITYKKAGFRLFVCGANIEYRFVKDNYGYPKGYVQCLGLARFDNLKNDFNNKQILIMPSWRSYLNDNNFLESDYFNRFNSLLNNKMLIEFIENNNITLYFYPHRNMQKYINNFKTNSKNIKIVDYKQQDIQELLIQSALMITDYSSVTVDFAYMDKPIIYYQFDKEDFHKHLKNSYFSYEDHGFGKVENTEEKVVKRIIKYINNNYKIEKKYQERSNVFFKYHDKDNCKRIYQEILKIRNK